MSKCILYWFRNDLRLHDNEGFARAVTDAACVLPVFVFDPKSFSQSPKLELPKTGPYRAKFLIEAVADLRQSLRAKGADLIVRLGNPAVVLATLAEETNASAVYTSKEVTQEETDDESALSKQLKPLNIDLELFWGSTLYHVRDLPFSLTKLPSVFTQFRHLVEKSASIRAVIPTPDRVTLAPDRAGNAIEPDEFSTLNSLGFSIKQIDQANHPDARRAVSFEGGETVALHRLDRYLWTSDLIETYKETRNGLIGENYSTKFSAWLSLGCLSPRLIYQEVTRYEAERTKNDSTYWLIFELLWRDFFRFVALRYGNRIFKSSGIRHVIRPPYQVNEHLFSCWTRGETGIPFIDANMREMNATGYMSNRGRQNVGSFLVNDLGLDWTLGAAYFESFLVDYDPCSNWGNWNYIAGVGNDPRTTRDGQARYFNIHSQATRYDERGAYVKHWLPELANVPAEKVHLVSNLTTDEQQEYGVFLGDTYPLPVINPNKWLTAENHH